MSAILSSPADDDGRLSASELDTRPRGDIMMADTCSTNELIGSDLEIHNRVYQEAEEGDLGRLEGSSHLGVRVIDFVHLRERVCVCVRVCGKLIRKYLNRIQTR